MNQIRKGEHYKAKNLVKILENNKITKIGHYLRYDVSGLEYFLKCEIKNIFDTKIASKLCRTYTQNHGLKDLVLEFCGKKLDKRLGSSDWNKDLEKLSDAQLQYCSNDVIYLHKIKEDLNKMLVRENRLELYQSCINFLKTRINIIAVKTKLWKRIIFKLILDLIECCCNMFVH